MPARVEDALLDPFEPRSSRTAQLSEDAAELLATRPAHAVRAFVYLLIPLLIATFAWAALSRVDVIVIADATLAAEGDVLKVRAPMAGVLRGAHFRAGETVEKGAVLFELASVEAAHEVAAIERTRQLLAQAQEDVEKRFPERKAAAARRIVRLEERLRFLDELVAKDKEVAEKAAIESDRTVDQKLLETKTRRTRLPEAASEVALRETTLARLDATLKKSEKMLQDGLLPENVVDLAHDKVEEAQIGLKRARMEKLGLESDIESLELEVTRLRNALTLRLAEIDKEVIQNRATASSLTNEIDQVKADLDLERSGLQAKLDAARVEAESARRSAFQGVSGDSVAVTAPTGGIVTQVAVSQTGELVSAGDLVLTIRPKEARLVAETLVLNKDIGHIKVGQKAKIKYAAFPFTDYGIKTGKVTDVAPDVTQHAQLGPVYAITVVPDEATIRVSGVDEPLSFGLKATVEIVTEQRSVLSFFLRPFQELSGDGSGMPR